MRLAVPILFLLTAGCLNPLMDAFRATEVEAPEWKVGDWWTYRLSSDVYATESEVTIVVANVTSQGYILGTPAEADATAALLQHLPAIGPIRKDLSWEVHETRFEGLRFPLEDEARWSTTWITSAVHLHARHGNGTWNITNARSEQESGMRYDITYDPAVKWFTHFGRTGLDGRVRIALDLTANGTDHVGEVRTITSPRVLMLESRTQGSISGGAPAPPNPGFTPPAGIDTILVGCLVGGSPGQYHAEVRSPTGVVCTLDETIPPGDLRVRSQIVEAPFEDGAWEARLASGGSGSATAEVLGYSTAVVTLPTPAAP